MKLFIQDKELSYSYNDLLGDINASDEYIPFFQSANLYLYFVNLIKGIVSGQDFTMLDSDISLSELTELDIDLVNKQVKICKPLFGSIEEIICLLHKSNSRITIFTSGTTGQPKKVIHNLSTLTRFVRVSDENRVWGFAYNPSHMAGLQVFFQAFENQNTLVNIFNFTRSAVYEAIEKNNITHISATPTFYRLLLPVEKSYLSVKRVTLGGERSDSHLYNSIHTIFPNAKINNIYASTEAGSLFVSSGEYFRIPDMNKDKFKVKDNELLIHKSLLGDSADFTYEDDFYKTGDLIEWIDEAKSLFVFKYRKNELINVGGYKVNPADIESAILQLPEVQQVLVFGKRNSILGNILCAEVELIPGCNISELEIKHILQKKFQSFKIPRIIKFVDKITQTRTGKLKRL